MKTAAEDKQMTAEENALQRYSHWAFKMYRHFVDERNVRGSGPDSWMYLSIWFALLYTTVEGWQELCLTDDEIDRLLQQTAYVSLLRRYRNGVDHFQKLYWDDRFADMVAKPETARWAESLTEAFGNYFARRAVEADHPALRR